MMCILFFDFSPQAFENTLKSWEDKLKYDKPPLRPHLYPQQSVDLATEEESALVQMCARAAEELITRYTSWVSGVALQVHKPHRYVKKLGSFRFALFYCMVPSDMCSVSMQDLRSC